MSLKEICPISKNEMKYVFDSQILKKYTINYYYCCECGLLKTEKPYWLDEAYSEAIAEADTGLVGRNLLNSKRVVSFLTRLSGKDGNILDVSGGYGLLARLLRDKGFNCFTTDKFCKNIFSKTFEPGANFHAEMLVSFEVLEHIESPVEFIKENFQKYHCKTILFSTETFEEIPPIDWWYYSFGTGQHITFYQQRTLAKIAEMCGCRYFGINKGFHLITNKVFNQIDVLLLFNRIIRRGYTYFLEIRLKNKGRTFEDHKLIIGRKLKSDK